MRTKGFRMIVPILAIAMGTGGCFVSASKFEDKTREADTLRDALAYANKERGTFEARILAYEKQISDEKQENEILLERNRDQEKELRAVKEELAAIVKKYEGTRITREELISELLEKEKATGKRSQERSASAQEGEAEREQLREEAAARDGIISKMEKQVEEFPDIESLRRERNILTGRLERMKEERLLEARRRDARFAELVQTFSGISPDIAVAPAGPAMRVLVPDKVLFQKGKTALTDAGRKVIGEMGKTASEFPAASIIVTARGKSQANAILGVLTKGHELPPGRVLASAGSATGGTELLLVIP